MRCGVIYMLPSLVGLLATGQHLCGGLLFSPCQLHTLPNHRVSGSTAFRVGGCLAICVCMSLLVALQALPRFSPLCVPPASPRQPRGGAGWQQAGADRKCCPGCAAR